MAVVALVDPLAEAREARFVRRFGAAHDHDGCDATCPVARYRAAVARGASVDQLGRLAVELGLGEGLAAFLAAVRRDHSRAAG